MIIPSKVKAINDWLNVNNLFLNAHKTFYEFHNREKNISEIDLKQDVKVTSLKFLGVVFYENLTWKDHCGCVISKLHSLKYLLKNLKIVLNFKQSSSVYHAQVGARLRYNILFWGNAIKSANVFIAQKSIVRLNADIFSSESCKSYFV